VTVRRKIPAEVEERLHTPMLPRNFEELIHFTTEDQQNLFRSK